MVTLPRWCGCEVPATFAQPDDGTFVMSNGIVERTLTVDPATRALSTSELTSLITGIDKLHAGGSGPLPPVLAEAELSVNGVDVVVGGPAAADRRAGTVQLVFSGEPPRVNSKPVAGNFTFVPGWRHTRTDRSWPPHGLRVEFDHVGPCSAVNAGADGNVTATVTYELFQGTSAFGKRLALSHSCSEPLFVFNTSVHVQRHRNVKTGIVEAMQDGQAGMFLKGTSLSAPGSSIEAAAYEPVAQSFALDRRWGPGLSDFRAGEVFVSFMVLELIHDANDDSSDNPVGGFGRFGLESSAAWRVVVPQTEQYPIQVEAVCNGGDPSDSPTGTPGYWCYDATGTAGMFALLDQAAEVGVEMVSWGINMNDTWRSSVGVEFQSAANKSWFKNITDYANARGIETGAYELLRNARSATFYNGAAPQDAADHALHPNAGYDCQDMPPPFGTGLTCHKNNKSACTGGPGCCALCAGTEFFDAMSTSVLDFWDATGLTAVDQDGAETFGPVCANESHVHHHGLNDSLWVNYQRTMSLFRSYCDRGGYIQGMPGLHLEGGQSKRPGGYAEMTYSLPRWVWIHRTRYNVISPGRSQTESNAVREFPLPLVPYHPSEVRKNPRTGELEFNQVDGFESSATIEPIDDHLVELEWALSQMFGTGVSGAVRGYRIFQSDQSKAVWTKWVSWFKRYRHTLVADFHTLQCSTACDKAAFEGPSPNASCTLGGWDGVIHWSPASKFPEIKTRAVAVIWNPLPTAINGAEITLPLYYAGFSSGGGVSVAAVREQEGTPTRESVQAGDIVKIKADLKPMGITYFVVEEA